MTCCLCVLFNHPYPANISALERIYGRRFPTLRFVIPQAETGRPDTLTVFRGSYTFQGMVVDAIPWLPLEPEWYIFIQDDALIRPDIDEGNIVQRLKLAEGDAFLPELGPIHMTWPWAAQFLWRYFYPLNVLSGSGFENLRRDLPAAEAAWAKAARLGVHPYAIPKLGRDELPNMRLLGDERHSAELLGDLVDGLYESGRDRAYIDMDYPFVCGISDLFVVHRSLLPGMRRVLGAFTAAGTFAEVAIPTALLLEANRLIRARDCGQKFDWVWGQDRERLLHAPIDQLFASASFLVHPVKLGMLRDNPERYEALLSWFSGAPPAASPPQTGESAAPG